MAWPETNEVGNCWCGHTREEHCFHCTGRTDLHCKVCKCIGGFYEEKGAKQ